VLHHRFLVAAAIAAIALTAAACGGGGGDDTTTPTTAAPARTAVAATPEKAASTAAPRATLPPRASGADYDEPAANALIEAALLLPEDLDVLAPWKVQSDATQDNTAFAAAQPDYAGDVETCGRLAGRTVTLQPEDILNAFIGGETLTFFSQLTVYKNAAGATACADLAAQRLAVPGALARLFSGVFIDPNAVIVTPVDYPRAGDSSFAATLTGQTNAQGAIVDITILVVGFRTGNVTAAVGSVRSGAAPPQDELRPYVDLVLGRLQANQ
jgi:hypothetical protein